MKVVAQNIPLLFMRCIVAMAFLLVCSCTNNSKHTDEQVIADLDSISTRGVLNVLTLSSSTSYFLYKGEARGYEYEMIKKFADDMGLKLHITVADNIQQLSQKLLEGKGDIIAYPMPIIGDTKSIMRYCGTERESEQVLVQQDIQPITDVIQLIGKDIYVEQGSKYEERLNNLNNELGGGIHIHLIDRDTIVTEDLIEMVSKGEIPYTLADENLARLNRTYYHNIDLGLKVSFPQRAKWAVHNNAPQLAQAVDEWAQKDVNDNDIKAINKRYFELSKEVTGGAILSIADGRISQYDEIFKREAQKIGWDWRLLASMAYHESRFDSSVVSWAGARGIMQLMPATASAFGVGMDSIAYPGPNVRAAVKSIEAVEKSIQSITDPHEKLKFTLAAYNSGVGHLFDAIALAKKYGMNPQIWYGEVEEAMLMKGNPEYYNDEVCRCGYLRGRQTTSYVREVMALYNYYCEKIPQ